MISIRDIAKKPQVFTHASCSAAHFWSHNHSVLSGQKKPPKICLQMFIWFPLEEQQQNPASNLLTYIPKIPKDLDKTYPIHAIRNRNTRRAMSPQMEVKLMSEQKHHTVTMRPWILSYRRHHSHWDWVQGVSEVSSLGCHGQQASFWEFTSLHHFFIRHAMVAGTYNTMPNISGHIFLTKQKTTIILHF